MESVCIFPVELCELLVLRNFRHLSMCVSKRKSYAISDKNICVCVLLCNRNEFLKTKTTTNAREEGGKNKQMQ